MRESKARYRVGKWAANNAGLINRGNVTMWINEAALAKLPHTEPTRGRPRLYSKRCTWRKAHLALDANTGQVRAALMTHRDVADGDVLTALLDRIPRDEPVDVLGVTEPTIPNRTMPPLPRAPQFPRSRRATARLIGQRILRARAGVTTLLT